MVEKLLNMLLKKPLEKINSFINGYKTYAAGLIIILPAVACLLNELIKQELTVDGILLIAKGNCIKQIGEGLAIIGFRSAIKK